MKADALTNKPTYELLKQSDIVDFYHLQFPRWLIEDKRYIHMTLEAKFTYTLLFNRFQLSKRNGWMNEDGEVFIIYTRSELAGKLNVGEKRITAAMNELRAFGLIWERRCGRGYANQIYLARVRIAEQDAMDSSGGPIDALPEHVVEEGNKESRTADMTGLDDGGKCTGDAINGAVSAVPTDELPIQPCKNRPSDIPRSVETAGQEPPNPPPSHKNYKQEILSDINSQVSQGQSDAAFARTPFAADITAANAEAELAQILSNISLAYFDDGDAAVIRDAVERLYFTQSLRIGSAVYPNDRIRAHLRRLDDDIVQDALCRLHNNRDKIKNSSAYTLTVLFNTIMESKSDMLLDPYLNHLRAQKVKAPPRSDTDREPTSAAYREGGDAP